MVKFNLVALTAMVAVMSAAQAQAQTSTQVPTSMAPGTDMVGVPGCHFGEKIDKSTAQDAHRILAKAGYTSIGGLKKSCDNNWHGHAVLNGVATNVMVTPDGRIVPEGS
jgi:hypothetical protein